MILHNYIAQLVHENFDNQLKGYNFRYSGDKKTEREVSYFFLKDSMLLSITYNYPNHFIEIDLYRETDVSKLIRAERISLRHIMKDKKNDFSYEDDYVAVMPNNIPLESSLKILSEYLIKYGDNYLKGAEWKTNRDILW